MTTKNRGRFLPDIKDRTHSIRPKNRRLFNMMDKQIEAAGEPEVFWLEEKDYEAVKSDLIMAGFDGIRGFRYKGVSVKPLTRGEY